MILHSIKMIYYRVLHNVVSTTVNIYITVHDILLYVPVLVQVSTSKLLKSLSYM